MFDVTNAKRVHIEQGTPEWLDWRENLYTASDAPAVMGVSPWFPRTPLELWKRKMGKQSVIVNHAMRAGQADENVARMILESQIGRPAPAACWEATVNGMNFGASYDGYDEQAGEIFEIKRPSRGSASDLWISSDPGQYRWQMLHQLICNPEVNRCSLVLYAHDLQEIKFSFSISRLDLDFETQAIALINAWQNFNESMVNLTLPAPTEKDVVEVADEEFAQLAGAWLVAKAAADSAETVLEQKRKELLEAAKSRGDGLAVLGAGIKIYPTLKPGNVNWKAAEIVEALKAAKVDPDKFRTKSIQSWTIREVGNDR